MFRSDTWIAAAVGAALVVSGLALEAAAEIEVTVGDGTTNPGDYVEIPVSLANNGAAPQVLVLFVAFDNAKMAVAEQYYERILTDIEGNPIRDGEGNVVTSPSAVRPESPLLALTYSLDYQVHPEGAIAMFLSAPGGALPAGHVLTLAFEVFSSVAEGAELDLPGLDRDFQMVIAGEPAYSSAAAADGGDLELEMIDGIVSVGCIPAETPANVAASTGRADAVEVTWDAVADPNAEYRVFRGQTNQPATASPLGDSWQQTTSFADITAAPPIVVDPGGCFRDAVYTRVSYFYWVKARTGTGCESEFSVSAQGSRAPAKSASVESGTVAKAFPRSAETGPRAVAAPGAQLAVRIDAGAAIEPNSVRVEALVDGSVVCQGYWVAGARGGWAACDAPGVWSAGETVVLRAGAATLDGVPVGPVLRSFEIRAVEEGGAAAGVTQVDADALPWLGAGIGVAYAIGPQGVYAAPVQVSIPVPEEVGADMLPSLHYYEATERRWYPAERVTDWLVVPPERRGDAVVFSVRHAGTVQLALDAPAPAAASIVPVWPRPDGVLAGLALLCVFFVAGRRARRAH